MAAYYAWWHEGRLVRSIEEGEEAAVFIEADTRFGPVGILRATGPPLVAALLERVSAGPRYLMTTPALADALRAAWVTEPERNRVLWLPDGARLFRGRPAVGRVEVAEDRASVLIGAEVAAQCQVLWRSPRFAELSVWAAPEHRGRGLARVVVSTLSATLLGEGVTPLYVAAAHNVASLGLAASLGFAACAAEELAGDARFDTPAPPQPPGRGAS